MISPFEAVVTWYNSLEEKEVKSFVITFAESFAEAMEHIENDYGKDLCEVRLSALEEQDTYELDTQLMEGYGIFKMENGVIKERKSNQA